MTRAATPHRLVPRVPLVLRVPLALLAPLAQLALVGALAASAAPAPSARALAHAARRQDPGETALYGYQPLTPWRLPPLRLPAPAPLNYAALAGQGIAQSGAWRHRGWYCEYLGCANGRYPLATLWASVPWFEASDALERAAPSPAHLRLLDRFARRSERYWDRAAGGYAPYPGDRAADVEIWFDDNGWLGLAFYNAYSATGNARWLKDAQRALPFIVRHGWDAAGGGGMWWNTHHPYHSGPALASDALLAVLLYGVDHEAWQLQDARTWVDWANANDDHDERSLYLEQPSRPESVNDYVQSPLIYAQYLLCQDGQGDAYCERAGRVAATMVEQRAIASAYRCNYGPEYDAIYLQWMMAYGAATGQSYWLQLAEVNAAAAASNASESRHLWLASWWGGRIADPNTYPNMFRTAGATTSLFAWVAAYSAAPR